MNKKDTDRLNAIVNKYSAMPDEDNEIIPYSRRPWKKEADNTSAYIKIMRDELTCCACNRVLETQLYYVNNFPICENCHEGHEIISKDKIQVSMGDKWVILTRSKSGFISKSISIT